MTAVLDLPLEEEEGLNRAPEHRIHQALPNYSLDFETVSHGKISCLALKSD
jgi:hypothetical protein